MSRAKLNMEETGYVVGGEPAFGRVFQRAMSFHFPEGMAAVRDASGAYHITSEGHPAYARRYLDAAGFYGGLAAVRDARGWFHIRTDGNPAHVRRFRWSGNFQEARCPVQDSRGFLHVCPDGTDAYAQRYSYVGDFKGGVAVAHSQGEAFHIRPDGSLLTGQRHKHAEPFHKSYAVVRDESGFFHVDRAGHPLHHMRFAAAEPFYNGVALCRTSSGDLLRLRENGSWIHVAPELEPISITGLREHMLQGHRVGLFIRHAERHPIEKDSPTWGNEVLLTPRGIDVAARLGRQFRGLGKLAFRSSPVERCRHTCAAMAEGAGLAQADIHLDRMLGDPGFLIDGSGSHELPMKADYHAFTSELLTTGHAPGTKPMAPECDAVLAQMHTQMAGAACTIFLSHDLFVAVMMAHLGLKAPTREDWCAYLEGVCLIETPSGFSFRRFAGEEAIP